MAPDPIALLSEFFEHAQKGTLFTSTDPQFYHRMRGQLVHALYDLLVWQRPALEQSKGLLWPYENLRSLKMIFERQAENTADGFAARQAWLFLARLPFPGQWEWLKKATHELRHLPEMTELLNSEQKKIQAKLAKKHQKSFKLRHFCQILKKPQLPESKGILRIFSLPYLFHDPNLLTALNKRYFLYVEPPWGVLYRQTWCRVFSEIAEPCLWGLGGAEDAGFMSSQPGTLTTPLAHGDFLAPDETVYTGRPKSHDIVFNGTFDDMPRKRHFFLLELLAQRLLEKKTVLIIGRGETANVAKFKRHVRDLGLENRVTVRANLFRQDVPLHLANCRMGLHLALHENGCRNIYEFFRSDLPCVISTCTAGVNLDLFTPETGIAAADQDLPEAVSRVLENPGAFSPRSWFLRHSGSRNTTKTLNKTFKNIFKDLGYVWTEDIVPLGSSGASRYLPPSDYQSFRKEFELLFEIFRQWGKSPVRLTLD
jgi:glycosyltransferase involved in cell wall biosynthesis